jgi:hypothetical protein
MVDAKYDALVKEHASSCLDAGDIEACISWDIASHFDVDEVNAVDGNRNRRDRASRRSARRDRPKCIDERNVFTVVAHEEDHLSSFDTRTARSHTTANEISPTRPKRNFLDANDDAALRVPDHDVAGDDSIEIES